MSLYLTEAEVGELCSPEAAFAAVEGSLHRQNHREIANPARVRLDIPDGVFAVMPCVDRGLGLAGLKTFAWTPGGAPFLVVLLSLAEHRIEAVLEAAALGELRTAAASAVAARHLARPDATTLGIFECGRQAASHVVALRAAFPAIEHVIVHGRSAERRDAFCREHDARPAASPAEAARCDIVVTATTSTELVVRGKWLTAGAFVCAVGANEPASRELDDEVLLRAATISVDLLEQARAEVGDLIDPARRGVVRWSDVVELHTIVAGDTPGRQSDAEITLFKSSGLAAWDLALAHTWSSSPGCVRERRASTRRRLRRPRARHPHARGCVRAALVSSDSSRSDRRRSRRAAGRDGARGSGTARSAPRSANRFAETRTRR
ncbi:MAG: ornithine cyclodeaminase family protein [Actinobacteria bacterium]|nr:ornithine cyclodeaminase family protein [Actinomycetota bacterium]